MVSLRGSGLFSAQGRRAPPAPCRGGRFRPKLPPRRGNALGRETIMRMTRRGLLGAAPAALATSMLGKPASAAEFEFKLGVNTPDAHPLTVRLIEAAGAIGSQSGGRLHVTVFPNSQLGGDPEMLS